MARFRFFPTYTAEAFPTYTAQAFRHPPLLVLSLAAFVPMAIGLTACPSKDDVTTESAGGDEDDDGEGTTTGFTPDPTSPGSNDTSPDSNSGTSGPSQVTTGPDPSDGTDETGGGFIDPPDGGVSAECDPAAQDCPEGQKCTSYVSMPGERTVDTTKCVDIMGTDQWGEQCERFEDNDTCDAGFFCMTDVSGHTGQGICLEYCVIDQPCEFGGECFAFNDGALPICQVTCHPLAPSCPQDQGCYAAFDQFVCAFPGYPEGLGGDNDPCSTIQSCQPGLVCALGTAGCEGETSCCTPYCDLAEGDAGCTDPTESCIQALEDPPPGFEDVGLCAIPE